MTGKHPETGDTNVRQRLKRAAPEALGEEALHPKFLEFRPGPVVSVELVEEDPKDEQADPSFQSSFVGGGSAVALNLFQQHEPQRESHRKEEVRHHNIGITAVRIVVPEDSGDTGEAAEEIHHEHRGHRVATELI